MYMTPHNIKEEQRKNIGIEPVVDMKHFLILLLADLASKSPIVDFDNPDQNIACLSIDYKKIIESIMYEENGWGIKFATLINIHSYYEYQQEWESKLGRTLNKVLIELNKNPRYDFEDDDIEIYFEDDEIKSIKSNYDEETLAVMDHFSNLMASLTIERKLEIETREMNRTRERQNYNIETLKQWKSLSDKCKKKKH